MGPAGSAIPGERLATDDKSASPERASLLTRDFLLVMAGYLVGMLAHGMAIWSIASFVDAMGLDAWIGGVALGGIAFTALASRRIAGRAIDRGGSRRPAYLGTAVMIVGGLFYRLSAEAGAGNPLMLALLAVAVMIHGAGFATMTTASFSFVGEAAPPGRRGEAIGYYSAFQPIVQGLAATASFAVVAAGGFGLLFVAVPVAAAGATILFWLMREPHRETRSVSGVAKAPVRFDRAVLAPVVMVGILTSAGGAATLTIPLLGLGAGIGNPGVFYLANAVSGFAMRLVAGRISDRQGRWKVAGPGLIMVSVAFAGLAAFCGLGMETFVIAGVVYGCAMAAALPALQALVLDRGLPEHRGANVAVMGMGQDIGYGTGSVLTGFVVGALGPAPGLVAGCVGPLASLALLAVDTKRGGPARSDPAAAEAAG